VTSKIFKNSFQFVLLVLLQVLIVKNINLGTYFIMLPYIMFILILPFETPRLLVLVFAFFLGLVMDMFYSTPGLHASASLTMGFARHYVLQLLSPREGYDPVLQPVVSDMGPEWFVKYAAVLIPIHHIMFFYLEVFRFNEFFTTFLRFILSSIGTFGFIYLIQFIFFSKSGKK
jgi:hypothetical protein